MLGALGLVVIGLRPAYAEAQRRPVPPKPPVAPMLWKIDGDDPVVQAFEQQWGAPFRQLYRSELHFLRQVTEPTRAQYAKIAADGEVALKATIQKFAREMQGPVSNEADPRTPLTAALTRSVRAHLSREQAARYECELEQRVAARKQAMVLNLVVKIDKLLLLTADQRGRLGEVLHKHWHDSWNQVNFLTLGLQYVPNLPDAQILPLLTATQRRVWSGRQQNGNIRFGFNLGIVQGVDMDEEAWDEAPAPAKEPAKPVGKQ